MTVVLLWAWEAYGKQHLDVLSFDDEEMAMATGKALHEIAQIPGLQGEVFSRVRVFRTPDLEEVAFPWPH